MNVAHMCVVTPGRCGLYETTRELVVALKQQGVNSRLVEPTPEKSPIWQALKKNGNGHLDGDRGATFGDLDWAIQSDVIVNHSGYDSTPVEKTGQPIVHVAHGRPRSSFLSESTPTVTETDGRLEAKHGTPIYSYWYSKNNDPRFKAIVTFWPQHKPYLEVMFPGRQVHVVQSSVDLQAWSPDGPKGYRFGDKKGEINIVCTDAFRDDIDPFVPLHAAALFARRMKGVKVHVYAKPKSKDRGWGVLLRRIQEDGNLGEVHGWVGGLANVYRAASLLLTAQDIDTRSVREAMACGCPVVRMQDLNPGFEAKILAGIMADRKEVRREAEARFNPERTAQEFKAVLDSL